MESFRWIGRFSFPLRLGSTAAGLVTGWYVFDISPVALVGAGLGMVLVNLWDVIERRYGLNRGWGKLPLGIGLFALGLYSVTYSGGMEAVKAGFILSGAWVMLDGSYDLRSGIGARTAGTPNSMEQFGDAAIVGRTLEREPQTTTELEAALDLSPHRIQNALDMLVNADAIAERGGSYYATLGDRSLTQTLRNGPSRFADRLHGVPA